ncbi:hypothetical protein N658DRAFT_471227 [Parathielavia hyrcaniae]|uniref:Integral membrane protein n=1 Tax=Parathielavia hyrcaniae TaxID=113614 RepID=A0AAN6Q459_9PEZI|nr:hypothetical protein N658DRAFT_471227 [Parathielavia hyrcaniae]
MDTAPFKSSSSPSLTRRRWDSSIPPALRPVVRAYLLGYAYAVGPRLLTLLLQHVVRRRLRKRTKKQTTTAHDAQNGEPFSAALRGILVRALDWQRFPTFCAALVGGTTLLEVSLAVPFFHPHLAVYDAPCMTLIKNALLQRPLAVLLDSPCRISRWLASFIAAWLSLRLLQSKQTPSFTDTVSGRPGPNDPPKTVHLAGRTLDLTLFAVTRALDVLGGELWHRRKLRRQAAGTWTRAESAISRLTDPAVFAISSGLIMWTWIYLPPRLPRAYNKWIGSAAAVDPRLITALQRCRQRDIIYGRDTGQAPLLGSMCADYGWPAEWGDPAKTVPFPCEMVHMGCGPSCELHAVSRFARSFRWAMVTYLPLSLVLAARGLRRSSSNNANTRNVQPALRSALLSSTRSSSFLATFITLFYYGVCLARNRLGPILPLGGSGGHNDDDNDNATAARASRFQRIDGGLCVGAGCVLCGWSILLEHPGRRKDMALFVAPRALAALFPRRYALDAQWRETLAFAASTAVVFTCVAENRARVRGMMGSVLGTVLG